MSRFVLALLLMALLAGAALFGLWVAFGAPAEGVQLIVNGQQVSLRDLTGWHAAAGGLGLLAALLVVGVVLPLTLLLAVLLPVLLVLGAVMLALGAVLGIGALAIAPLLPLLLLWWLWRRSRRAAAPASPGAGTTIDA